MLPSGNASCAAMSSRSGVVGVIDSGDGMARGFGLCRRRGFVSIGNNFIAPHVENRGGDRRAVSLAAIDKGHDHFGGVVLVLDPVKCPRRS
jgi:hypothetical protein